MDQASHDFLDISNPRYWVQNANLAIRDVYDALVELITNADDRYEILGVQCGRIEIEIDRRRKGTPSIVRVRDFADGMMREDMHKKLGRVGDRVSGLAEGKAVRGTNSRGAKDIAVLGGVSFESIACDGKYHKCEITPQGRFLLFESESSGLLELREKIGITEGTGTLVTVTIDSAQASVPQHDNLKKDLSLLVPLRDILASPSREIYLTDLRQEGRRDRIRAPMIEGTDRVKETLRIPGYPQATAKLVIKRAKVRLEDQRPKFRLGGILVKSQHAIHDSTLFAPDLEHDPHAQWFFGKLTCEYIDTLWNEFDDCFERGQKAPAENPRLLIDPLRRYGLVREHPFVDALYKECLKRLRPLVEEERRQAESSNRKIESEQTRKRLRELERAAAKFISENREDDEPPREPDAETPDSLLAKNGYSLNPPYCLIQNGHSTRFWLTVRRDVFPELSAGDAVEISTSGKELTATKKFTLLEQHPKQENLLRSIWQVRANEPTKAAGIRAQVGPIVAESTVEVYVHERERYSHVTELCFGKKRYGIRAGERRTVQIFAPYPGVISTKTPVELDYDKTFLSISGEQLLVPYPELGVAICRLKVSCATPERSTTLTASACGHSCSAEIRSLEPIGAGIQIEFHSGDWGNQRSFWRGSTLYVAARHPSLARYLGPGPEYPGQEEKHFRVLLAEIVADAVCYRLIERNVEQRPQEYSDWDWAAFYAEYSRLMTKFLPVAHETQLR